MSDHSFLVATLVADSRSFVLSSDLVKKASCSVNAEQLRFLAPGIACDFLLPQNLPEKVAYHKLQEAIGSTPIDIILQRVKNVTKDIINICSKEKSGFFSCLRRKKLLLADMDSTMIEQECIDELAARVNLRKQMSMLTERAMTGVIDFEPALQERVFLLKGLPLSVLDDVAEESISLMTGGPTLVQTMRTNGAYTALISGGFSFFTKKIAARIGFDEENANILDHDGEKLTGLVKEPILGKIAKKEKLIKLCNKKAICISESLAVGDGANDLDMLLHAGMGVAFHAKPAVSTAAPIHIDHADLSALLYIQGYSNNEFCETTEEKLNIACKRL